MTTVAQLSSHLQTLFTSTANQLARRSGFVQRRSKLTGALFAQALVFGWLADPQAPLSALAQAAATAGVGISPQGLDQRCTESAAIFPGHQRTPRSAHDPRRRSVATRQMAGRVAL
jgi:hypothetical protein